MAKAKKHLALALALVTLFASLASCSESSGNSGAEAEQQAAPTATVQDAAAEIAEEEETAITDDLPEKNWDGVEFMIYNGNVLTNTWFLMNYVNFEEDSPEALESAVYRRNLAIEERFNINILETVAETGTIKTDVMAGASDFDIVQIDGTTSFSLAQQGFLYDQLKLSYIDLTKPYWDHNVVRFLTFAGKLYFTAGNFGTTHHDGLKTLFFNKGLVENYHLDDPYDCVREGTWTLEKFGSMIQDVTVDLDGNGVFTEADQYGLLSQNGSLYPCLMFGLGELFITTGDDGKPVTSYYNERFVSGFEKINDICHANGDTVMFDARGDKNGSGLGDRIQEVMFPNNQALFWIENLAWSKALRDMEMDFGIVPPPKLNEDQDTYYNICSSGFLGTSIPVCTPDLDRSCIVLEALNSMSGDFINAYQDVILKSKLSRDTESGEMIDIIFSNVMYDPAWNFNLSGCVSSLSNLLVSGNSDVASYYTKNLKVMDKALSNAYEKISAVDH